jgi:hypothetical protein
MVSVMYVLCIFSYDGAVQGLDASDCKAPDS